MSSISIATAPMAARSRRRRSGRLSGAARAARACKGKRGASFKACVKSKSRGR